MIAVFGHGVIGKAFTDAVLARSEEREHVAIVDPTKGFKATDTDLRKCSLVFVCVPTPTTSDRRQDLSAVFTVMRRLLTIPYEGLVVLRSTITPSNVRMLQRIYPLRIATLPEFLMEASASADAYAGRFMIVGACGQDQPDLLNFLARLWPGDATQYFYTTPAGAMLIKYWVNCCLASRVALANEFKLYWDIVGDGHWDQVSEGFALDPRCGDTHMVVPGPDGQLGFGGKCFPKDVLAIAEEIAARVEQWDGGVLDGALEVNARVRGSG